METPLSHLWGSIYSKIHNYLYISEVRKKSRNQEINATNAIKAFGGYEYQKGIYSVDLGFTSSIQLTS